MNRASLFSLVAVAGILNIDGFALAQERREVPELRMFGEPDPEQASAVEALVRQFEESWGRQDTEALMALHADDVEWINAYARIFRGTAALSDFLENRLFPEFDPEVSRAEAARMETISVRHLGDDAAVVHTYTESPRGPSRSPGEELRRTHIHLVLEKREGGWKIVHTAIMDAR